MSLLGTKSKDDSNPTIRCWFEYIDTDIVRDSIACCDWRLLYLCAYNDFDYLGWSI